VVRLIDFYELSLPRRLTPPRNDNVFLRVIASEAKQSRVNL